MPALTPTLSTEPKVKTYTRFLRVSMEKEYADQWDTLSKEEIEEISAPYQEDVLADLTGLLEKKAAQLAAQTTLLAEIPEDVIAQAAKIGLKLSLVAA